MLNITINLSHTGTCDFVGNYMAALDIPAPDASSLVEASHPATAKLETVEEGSNESSSPAPSDDSAAAMEKGSPSSSVGEVQVEPDTTSDAETVPFESHFSGSDSSLSESSQ
jgi:hypothetical protein